MIKQHKATLTGLDLVIHIYDTSATYRACLQDDFGWQITDISRVLVKLHKDNMPQCLNFP
jgi:hypothetical protein